jgi:hypothetical protein
MLQIPSFLVAVCFIILSKINKYSQHNYSVATSSPKQTNTHNTIILLQPALQNNQKPTPQHNCFAATGSPKQIKATTQ